jgi:hypothetical protein
MIAAARRRIATALTKAHKRTMEVDRAVARRIERVRPALQGRLRQGRAKAMRWTKAMGKRLRPVAVLLLRAFSGAERALRRIGAAIARAATAASRVLTPKRAICLVVLACAAGLVASQFISYRSVEIGQAAYAGLPAASPPTVGAETPTDSHSFVLIPIALLAAGAAAAGLRSERRGLGRIIVVLGLLVIAVTLLIDLPAGLDAGAQSARFSGATAVLEDGFYAQLAAGAGLVLGGLLYYARPCRIRINLSGRAASARRRRRRPRDSSRRKGARRPLRRRNGAVSAPASRP